MAKKEASKPRCFVISPIGEEDSEWRLHADMVLNSIIIPALPDYDVVRSDAFGLPEAITNMVIEALLDFELAVADLSFHNPNVFYELGIRHMMEKPVIPIALRDGRKIPFDNEGINTHFFNIKSFADHVAAREHLSKVAKMVMAKGYNVSNPVTIARGTIKLKESADSKDMLISEMSQRLASLERQIGALQVRHVPLTAGGGGLSVLAGGQPLTLARMLQSGAISDTGYLPVQPTGFDQAFNSMLGPGSKENMLDWLMNRSDKDREEKK